MPPTQGVARLSGRLLEVFRLQVTMIVAPCSGGAWFVRVKIAPDRSSNVLAMKKPSPRPNTSSSSSGPRVSGRRCVT